MEQRDFSLKRFSYLYSALFSVNDYISLEKFKLKKISKTRTAKPCNIPPQYAQPVAKILEMQQLSDDVI